MRETRKADKRRSRSQLFQKVFTGRGIDIGCGDDKLSKSVWKGITEIEGFDQQDGDAQNITKFKECEAYDFVYSSNCLEHMKNPRKALQKWSALVKDGGYLVFTVPDEDLYEQGVWPSQWNSGHVHSFTVHKNSSWCEESLNIMDLILVLEDFEIIKIEMVDTNYDHSDKARGVDQTFDGDVEAFIEVVMRKKKRQRKGTNQRSFKHSGARGDIVYSLPTVAALGGGVFYINLIKKPYLSKPLDKEEFERFREFLLEQDYIHDVRVWGDGQVVTYDLDRFRDIDMNADLISKCHLRRFQTEFDLAQPWLKCDDPWFKAEIVINRSPRYHGVLEWSELKDWQQRCLFVGFQGEYEEFVQKTGLFDVPLYTPSTHWELLRIIAGSRFFVGNQSFCYSIAEGLKKPRALEVCRMAPNCNPQSSNGFITLNQEVLHYYVDGIGRRPVNEEKHRKSHMYLTYVREGRTRMRDKSFRRIKGRPLASLVFLTDLTSEDEFVKSLSNHMETAHDAEIMFACHDCDKKEAEEFCLRMTEKFSMRFKMTHGRDIPESCNKSIDEIKGDFIVFISPGFVSYDGWQDDILADFLHDEFVGQILADNMFIVSKRVFDHIGLFDLNNREKFQVAFRDKLLRSGYKVKQVL